VFLDLSKALAHWALAEDIYRRTNDPIGENKVAGHRLALAHALPIHDVALAWRTVLSNSVPSPEQQPATGSSNAPQPPPLAEPAPRASNNSDQQRRQAEVARDALLARRPAHPDDFLIAGELADKYAVIGKLMQANGDSASAVVELRNALAIRIDLVKHQPNDRRTFDLALAHRTLGRALKAQGDVNGGNEQFLAENDILSGLIRTSPDMPEWQSAFAISEGDLAGVALSQNNLDEALSHQVHGSNILNELLKKQPDNNDLTIESVRSYDRLGAIRMAQGDNDHAFEALQLGLYLLTGLKEQFVTDMEFDALQYSVRSKMQNILDHHGGNIGLVVNDRGRLCMVYDTPFPLPPLWVAYHVDKKELDIIFIHGFHHYIRWTATDEMNAYLLQATKILMIRMQDKKPVEGWDTSFIRLLRRKTIS
jgi:tetratricopeptide (TPR) repeat protein